MKKLFVLPVLLVALLAAGVFAPVAAAEPTIVEIAASSDDFSTLVAAVQAAGLVDVLNGPGPFTVFAPTDAAFAKLLSGLGISAEDLLANQELLTNVLLYHVVPGELYAADVLEQGVLTMANKHYAWARVMGGAATINEAHIVATDIKASNGVIHVIDTVILPPAWEYNSFAADPSQIEANIVEIALQNEGWSTLVAAVQAAGLVETLSGPGPFTVFAPTNEAFSELLGELGLTAEELLANEPLLTSVLLYHVVPGRVFADDALAEGTLTMADGNTATVSTRGGEVYINGAKILRANINTSNGVLYVIDEVILPPAN